MNVLIISRYNIRTKTAERFDPSGDLALGSVPGAQLAPVADLDVV